MVAELNELKWLFILSYPLILLGLFAFWMVLQFRKSRQLQIKLTFLGLSLHLFAEQSNGSTVKDIEDVQS